MAKKPEKERLELNEGSAYGKDDNRDAAAGDVATEAALDRLEQRTDKADAPRAYAGELRREADKLDASTEEELDALRVNLTQDDDEIRNPRYGTGLIEDDLARERLAGATEVGPELAEKGTVSGVPGYDDTSNVLRRHRPKSALARAEDIGEGNLDEPRDEELGERKLDEDTAA